MPSEGGIFRLIDKILNNLKIRRINNNLYIQKPNGNLVLIKKFEENDYSEIKDNFNCITAKGLATIDKLTHTQYHTFYVIYKNRNRWSNIASITQEELSKKLGVSRREVTNNIKALKEVNLIKTEPSRIFVNPIISQGRSSHRQDLEREYVVFS